MRASNPLLVVFVGLCAAACGGGPPEPGSAGALCEKIVNALSQPEGASAYMSSCVEQFEGIQAQNPKMFECIRACIPAHEDEVDLTMCQTTCSVGPSVHPRVTTDQPPGGVTVNVSSTQGAEVTVTLQATSGKGEPLTAKATAGADKVAKVVFSSVPDGRYGGNVVATYEGVEGMDKDLMEFKLDRKVAIALEGLGGEGRGTSCVLSLGEPKVTIIDPSRDKERAIKQADDGSITFVVRSPGAKTLRVDGKPTAFKDGAATASVKADRAPSGLTVTHNIMKDRGAFQRWPVEVDGPTKIVGGFSCELASGFKSRVARLGKGKKLALPGDGQPDTTKGVVAIIDKGQIVQMMNATDTTPLHHFDGVAIVSDSYQDAPGTCRYKDKRTGTTATLKKRKSARLITIYDRRTGAEAAQTELVGATPACLETVTRKSGYIYGADPGGEQAWIAKTAQQKL